MTESRRNGVAWFLITLIALSVTFLTPALVGPQASLSDIATITADWATYQGDPPGWWAVQNPWGAGSLINGKNYSQAIYVYASTFPNGSVISWRWPGYGNPSNAWGYPEIVYGTQAGTWRSPDRKGPPPIKIRNLAALTGSYDLSIAGDTDQYDVLWETHLTSAPNGGASIEFGILLHTPSYVMSWAEGLPRRYPYNTAGLAATILITDNGSEPYILVLPVQGDMLTATVDIRSILNFLISRRALTGDEYISGFEIGAEPRQGEGTLTINSIQYNWNGNVAGRGVTRVQRRPQER